MSEYVVSSKLRGASIATRVTWSAASDVYTSWAVVHHRRERSMPYVVSVGTYLPCWGTALPRVAGDDEDAVTIAVEAGRAAVTGGGAVERGVVVSLAPIHISEPTRPD